MKDFFCYNHGRNYWGCRRCNKPGPHEAGGGPVRIPDSFNTLCTVNIILDINFLEFVALTLPLNDTSQTYFGWEKSFVPQATQSSPVFASGPTDDLASPLVVYSLCSRVTQVISVFKNLW
jgi:hypothetical protein